MSSIYPSAKLFCEFVPAFPMLHLTWILKYCPPHKVLKYPIVLATAIHLEDDVQMEINLSIYTERVYGDLGKYINILLEYS